MHFDARVLIHGSDASIINHQPYQRFYSLTWTQFLRHAELLELSEWDPVYSETRLLLRHRNNVEVDFSLKQESRPTTTQNPSRWPIPTTSSCRIAQLETIPSPTVLPFTVTKLVTNREISKTLILATQK